MHEGSIITFYSYKGGVGRTLILASVAALLSRWGYKVLCVDWDLEAPGLHLYYRKWVETFNSGLTELIEAHTRGEQPDWRDFVTPIHFPDAREPLSLMTAGVQDSSYVQRMQSLDWKLLYETKELGNFLEHLRQDWKQKFDFVLLDSRTGITDIGGICTIQLPDFLVLLFTANDQSLEGAIDIANRAIRSRNSLPFDRSKLLVLPIPTRFEGRIEYELAQEWLEKFAKKLAPFYQDWVHRNVKIDDLLKVIKVPYVPYWSFGEQIPILEESTKDPEGIGFALETIAALIARRLSSNDLLVNVRDRFVSSARSVANLENETKWDFDTLEQYLQRWNITADSVTLTSVLDL
jgi:cellulose biosynthesis protein BcsQ